MDFGIVKMVGSDRHTATGAVVGTALYLPPELIRGETPDARSDEYSLGVTLFEMVSGKPPFEADSAMTLMMMHLNDPLPDLRAIAPRDARCAGCRHSALAGEGPQPPLRLHGRVRCRPGGRPAPGARCSACGPRRRRPSSMCRRAWRPGGDECPTSGDSPMAARQHHSAPASTPPPADQAPPGEATMVAAAARCSHCAGCSSPAQDASTPAAGPPPAAPVAGSAGVPPSARGHRLPQAEPNPRRLPLLWIGGGALLVLALIIGGVHLGHGWPFGRGQNAYQPPPRPPRLVGVLPASARPRSRAAHRRRTPRPRRPPRLEPSPTATQGTPTLPPTPNRSARHPLRAHQWHHQPAAAGNVRRRLRDLRVHRSSCPASTCTSSSTPCPPSKPATRATDPGTCTAGRAPSISSARSIARTLPA